MCNQHCLEVRLGKEESKYLLPVVLGSIRDFLRPVLIYLCGYPGGHLLFNDYLTLAVATFLEGRLFPCKLNSSSL